jgi:hypothetical protein
MFGLLVDWVDRLIRYGLVRHSPFN